LFTSPSLTNSLLFNILWYTYTSSFFFHSLTYINLLNDYCTWSHSITHTQTHSVELLWTRDRPVAEAATWKHTTCTRDRQPCPWRASNPQS
jgi:hypothetical protein